MKSLNYSSNPKDEPFLRQLDHHLQSLTTKQKAALAVAALYEATEPIEVFIDYELESFGEFSDCIELIFALSTPGKLALTRAIAEELTVCYQIARAAK